MVTPKSKGMQACPPPLFFLSHDGDSPIAGSLGGERGDSVATAYRTEQWGERSSSQAVSPRCCWVT